MPMISKSKYFWFIALPPAREERRLCGPARKSPSRRPDSVHFNKTGILRAQDGSGKRGSLFRLQEGAHPRGRTGHGAAFFT